MNAVRYTPAGSAICEFTVAVAQMRFGQRSVGYFQAIAQEEEALRASEQLRIGKTIKLSGSLLAREYRNRRGEKQSEVKILVNSFTNDGGLR